MSSSLKTHFTGTTTAVIRNEDAKEKFAAWAKEEFMEVIAMTFITNINGQTKGYGTATSLEIQKAAQKAGQLGLELTP